MKNNITGEQRIKDKNIILLEGIKGEVISVGKNKRSFLLNSHSKEEQEIYFDSESIDDINGKGIALYHLYNEEKNIIAKDSIIVSSENNIFNKEMVDSFFEVVYSPVRTKEYLTGILSLILFSVCLFLFLSDVLRFSYGFKELFHFNELFVSAIILFIVNVFLAKKNNKKKSEALSSFYNEMNFLTPNDKGKSVNISLSRELKLDNRTYQISDGKDVFVKHQNLIKDAKNVVLTEEEKVSQDYNPITNTETITYRERKTLLSSSYTSYYNITDDTGKVKRVGVLGMDFRDFENIKYLNLIDDAGIVYPQKIVKKNGLHSYIRNENGNTTTENDLLKIMRIPFFNLKLLTMLFVIYFCYNYFTNDVRGAAMSMLIYFVLLVVKLIYKFYELNKKDKLDYDMKVFCHKIRNNL